MGAGALSARPVARLLGPTSADRLEVALTRLQAESEHTRLARELHDGIGHALTIIGVQAAAGRRALARDPDQAGSALSSIEDASRSALEELDDMLGLLRDTEAARSPEPDLDRLSTLVSRYRSAGMELVIDSAESWGRFRGWCRRRRTATWPKRWPMHSVMPHRVRSPYAWRRGQGWSRSRRATRPPGCRRAAAGRAMA